MKKPLIIIVSVFVLIVLVWIIHQIAYAAPLGVEQLARWTPTPVSLTAELGPVQRGHWNDRRHMKFRIQFQKRYRNHSFAVGIRTRKDGHLKLMVDPMIPRWYTARIATSLEREYLADFGLRSKVVIYETYIIGPQRLIGHSWLDPQGIAHVIFTDSGAR